jgi:hypothetical protein
VKVITCLILNQESLKKIKLLLKSKKLKRYILDLNLQCQKLIYEQVDQVYFLKKNFFEKFHNANNLNLKNKINKKTNLLTK